MKRPNKRSPEKLRPPTVWNDWTAWHAYCRQFGGRQLMAKGKLELTSVIFISPHEVRMVAVAFRNPQQKSVAFRTLAALAIAIEAEAVCVVSESWMLTVDHVPGETEDEHRKRSISGVRPNQSERRKEVLNSVLIYREGSDLYSYMSFDEIMRDDKARIERLKSVHDDGEEDPARSKIEPDDGSYATLLLPERPDASRIEIARRFMSMLDKDMLSHVGVFVGEGYGPGDE